MIQLRCNTVSAMESFCDLAKFTECANNRAGIEKLAD